MAKERSLLRTIIVNFWNSIKPRNVWGNRVGEDYNGTQYYEIPLTKSSARRRPPRWFVPRERDNFQQNIPPEWEAWLRYRRNEPPTEEEIQRNLAAAMSAREKAARLEEEHPKALQQAEAIQRPEDLQHPEPLRHPKAARVTSKNFPLYDDLEEMPGSSLQGNRFRNK